MIVVLFFLVSSSYNGRVFKQIVHLEAKFNVLDSHIRILNHTSNYDWVKHVFLSNITAAWEVKRIISKVRPSTKCGLETEA